MGETVSGWIDDATADQLEAYAETVGADNRSEAVRRAIEQGLEAHQEKQYLRSVGGRCERLDDGSERWHMVAGILFLGAVMVGLSYLLLLLAENGLAGLV